MWPAAEPAVRYQGRGWSGMAPTKAKFTPLAEEDPPGPIPLYAWHELNVQIYLRFARSTPTAVPLEKSAHVRHSVEIPNTGI